MPKCAICPTGRPKYQAYFIRQPIEGVTFEYKFASRNIFAIEPEKIAFFSGFWIPDPDF